MPVGLKARMENLKFKLTVAYDGTAYSGWQVQKIGTGVQEKLEQALARLFLCRPQVHSSSRTDTGVHAMGMVVHFEVPRAQCPMHPRKLALAINAWLPNDVRVLHAGRASREFHARFSATGKQYRYLIWNHPAMNPLLRHSAWHVPRPLDLLSMRRAARHFLGQHDFKSFAANPGYAKATTIRRLWRCDLKKSGPLLTFIIEGDSFLYKMCRGIVGTLVQVGLARFSADSMDSLLAQPDRRKAGMTAPAAGLVLWKVFYSKRPNASRSART